jgi:hypothetical protein
LEIGSRFRLLWAIGNYLSVVVAIDFGSPNGVVNKSA